MFTAGSLNRKTNILYIYNYTYNDYYKRTFKHVPPGNTPALKGQMSARLEVNKGRQKERCTRAEHTLPLAMPETLPWNLRGLSGIELAVDRACTRATTSRRAGGCWHSAPPSVGSQALPRARKYTASSAHDRGEARREHTLCAVRVRHLVSTHETVEFMDSDVSQSHPTELWDAAMLRTECVE